MADAALRSFEPSTRPLPRYPSLRSPDEVRPPAGPRCAGSAGRTSLRSDRRVGGSPPQAAAVLSPPPRLLALRAGAGSPPPPFRPAGRGGGGRRRSAPPPSPVCRPTPRRTADCGLPASGASRGLRDRGGREYAAKGAASMPQKAAGVHPRRPPAPGHHTATNALGVPFLLIATGEAVA